MKEVKQKIIELVNESSDDKMLQQIYSILDSNKNFQSGALWDELTPEEKEETLKSLEEADNPENIVAHEEVMGYIRKKFGWD